MEHREQYGSIERFDSIAFGVEFCIAYTELRDPLSQRNLFEEEQRRQEEGDDEAHPIDMDFVEALELGIPPTGGLEIVRGENGDADDGRQVNQECDIVPDDEKLENPSNFFSFYSKGTRENMKEQMDINGASAEKLAGEYGTPLFVYDADKIREQYR